MPKELCRGQTLQSLFELISKPGSATQLHGNIGTIYISGAPRAEPDEILRAFSKRIAVDDPPSIPRFDGQYAIAVESTAERAIYLIADPYGMQPVYYAKTPGGWAWSFQLKQLTPLITAQPLDPRGLNELFTYRWLMEDRTLLSSVRQVPPSHVVCLTTSVDPIVRRYERREFRPQANGSSLSSAIERTDKALDAYFANLRRRTGRIAIFFSGGVDSSLLLAKARAFDFDSLLAVTPTFPGLDNREAARAAAVARDLRVPVRFIEISQASLPKMLNPVVWQFERPPTYMNNLARAEVYRQISGDVEAVLSGEAADVMFSSERASSAQRYEEKRKLLRILPPGIRSAIAKPMAAAGVARLRRLAVILSNDTRDFMRRDGTYDGIPSQYPRRVGISTDELIPQLKEIRQAESRPFYMDYEPSSPSSIIAFCQDRGLYTQNRNQYYSYAALARDYRGLSVELPFLSNLITEIAFELPDALKQDPMGSKPILKKLASRYISKDLVYLPKLGFETPQAEWLAGPLKDASNLLFEKRTADRGIFDENVMQRLDPKRDADLIWLSLVLEIFLRQFLDRDPAFIP